MRRVVGAGLLASLLIGFFVYCCHMFGFLYSLGSFGLAFGVTGVVFLSVWLMQP